jgi:photosystem II stability/assembly factor-like uncharacterized protein
MYLPDLPVVKKLIFGRPLSQQGVADLLSIPMPVIAVPAAPEPPNETTRRPNLGNIGAEMAFDLTLSDNGRVLWLLGAVGGVASSTDGGSKWTRAGIATGGYGTRLVTAGPTSAWLPLPGYGLYRTTNGTTWTKLT